MKTGFKIFLVTVGVVLVIAGILVSLVIDFKARAKNVTEVITATHWQLTSYQEKNGKSMKYDDNTSPLYISLRDEKITYFSLRSGMVVSEKESYYYLKDGIFYESSEEINEKNYKKLIKAGNIISYKATLTDTTLRLILQSGESDYTERVYEKVGRISVLDEYQENK